MALTFGFLRAVNVGGRQMKMADIAEALRDLGLNEVETFIASGNVVFAQDERELAVVRSVIEDGLAVRFGFKSDIFLRHRADLAAMSKQVAALTVENDVAVNIAFVDGGQRAKVEEALAPWQSAMERFVVFDDYFIWLAKTKISETDFGKKGYTKKSMPALTMRNYNTIVRMLTKWGADS